MGGCRTPLGAAVGQALVEEEEGAEQLESAAHGWENVLVQCRLNQPEFISCLDDGWSIEVSTPGQLLLLVVNAGRNEVDKVQGCGGYGVGFQALKREQRIMRRDGNPWGPTLSLVPN